MTSPSKLIDPATAVKLRWVSSRWKPTVTPARTRPWNVAGGGLPPVNGVVPS
jgi:hypothetical protein